MNEYTATNGVAIRIDNGDLDITAPHATQWTALCGGHVVDALREFFRAVDDDRLGRWRWPENPDYVVHARGDRVVRVLRESTCTTFEFTNNGQWSSVPSDYEAAARACFEARSEPKPWHDAAEGEVWVLMFPGTSHVWFVDGDYFRSAKTFTAIRRTDPGIVAARRIWPEAD